MGNFWQQLNKPIMALAPMEDVTDTVFRQIIASIGKPDVMYTEFTNCDGLFSKGGQEVEQRLKFTDSERPLVAQIWGVNPDTYYRSAQLIKSRGFDGIDINMGCPIKKIVKKGACSALIENHQLAGQIIKATREGAGGLPVSVKTRIGFKTIKTEEWVGFLLKQRIDALVVHGRTAKEMSKVPVHWDEIGKTAVIKKKLGVDTIILGNGDVLSLDEAIEKVKQYKLDGIMIGRGALKDPGVFSGEWKVKSVKLKLKLLLKHVELFDKTWGSTKPFHVMRKYFKIYVSGFDGAKELRAKLMECKSSVEVERVVTKEVGSDLKEINCKTNLRS